MTAISGRSWLPLLKTYGLDGSLARMCEVLLTSRWASSAAFLTWKASDTAPSHLLFQLAPSAPRTDEIASGSSPEVWPAPTSQDNPQVRGIGKTVGTNRGTTLGGAVRMWPTPTTRDHKGANSEEHLAKGRGHRTQLPNAVKMQGHKDGQLNPTWVEWLMGYEIGHTDLKPSEMPSYRKSLRKSAKQSSRRNSNDD